MLHRWGCKTEKFELTAGKPVDFSSDTLPHSEYKWQFWQTKNTHAALYIVLGADPGIQIFIGGVQTFAST